MFERYFCFGKFLKTYQMYAQGQTYACTNFGQCFIKNLDCLTFPTSIKSKNLSHCSLNAVALISPDWSQRSMENSLPSPLELLQVRTSDLLETRALMVHL